MKKVHKTKGDSRVVLGNALDLIPKYLEENSVHAVVTDGVCDQKKVNRLIL